MSKSLSSVAKHCYEPLLVLFGLVYLPHFLLRLRQSSDPWRLIRERLGLVPNHFENQKTVWLHAVSVGEVMAAGEFVRLLLERHPALSVVISTTTPTGQSVAEKMESPRVRVIYFPFDFRPVVKKVLDMIHPDCIVILETEIWPNLIEETSQRGIPIGIVNGRISKRAMKRYLWVQEWCSKIFQKLSFCLVRGAEDQERFLSLGFPSERLRVTGDIKFDADLIRKDGETEALRKKWALGHGLLLVGGSTHEGEEEILIRTFKKLRGEFPDLKLVLAPRHTERALKAMHLVMASGLKGVFLSGGPQAVFDVLILDSVGILSHYYALADLTVIGGSFIPHGGQNPIEAARERKTILHGPHVFNFQDLYRQLDESGGAFLIRGEEELFEYAFRFLKSDQERMAAGLKAFAVVDGLKGACQRNLTFLEPWLSGEAMRLTKPAEKERMFA